VSCRWDIKCLDCNETHVFHEANHMDGLMLALCRHPEAIAALADVFADVGQYTEIKIHTYHGSIDPTWFRKHLGHSIMPIDEYGRLYNQCQERIECNCGGLHDCVLDINHEGDHKARGQVT
jgi:hypothetical protein